MAETPTAPAVPLRPAATVMLLRDHDEHGLEVLMLRRNLNSDFVGGAYVFPGGAVDPSDASAAVERRCLGRSDADASAILGLDEGGLAYWVAVLRECFEEAGILLARDRDGAMLRLDLAADAARFGEHRRLLNDRGTSFAAIAEAEDLYFDVAGVHYFAHWITPEGAPRRYDTRFFVAAAPHGQTPANDQAETIDEVWTSPEAALAAHRRSEIEMVLPTIRNLQNLARYETAAQVLDAAAAASTVPAILPRISITDRGVQILVPGDEGYEEAVPRREGVVGDFNAMAKAVSHHANQEPTAPPQA